MMPTRVTAGMTTPSTRFAGPNATASCAWAASFSKGGWYAWDTNDKPDDSIERGLLFVAINASIESQFEFVQQTWMNTAFFGGLTDELDPLVGMPDADDPPRQFTIQGAPLNRRFRWEKPLVTVRGGAYFFLPSKAALEFLASNKLSAPGRSNTVKNPNTAER
jgi:hypothetical protein